MNLIQRRAKLRRDPGMTVWINAFELTKRERRPLGLA